MLTNTIKNMGRLLCWALIVGGLLVGGGCLSQQSAPATVGNPSLRAELLKRVAEDQEIGREYYPKEAAGKSDPALTARRKKSLTDNAARIKQIVRQYGWPGPGLVGRDGSDAAFLLVQHSDNTFRREMLPYVRSAYEAFQTSGQNYALLLDIVLVAEGKPQVYGTRLKPFEQWHDQNPVPELIADEANVDKRRAEVGLLPLSLYLDDMKQMRYPGSEQKPFLGRIKQLPGGDLMLGAIDYLVQLKGQNTLPGVGKAEKGVFPLSGFTKADGFPVSRTESFSKENGDSIYYYTVVKPSPEGDWRLAAAWRRDASGRIVQRFPVQTGVGTDLSRDFVGRWVMKVGHRNFVVLVIRDDGAGVKGDLSRPQDFQESGMSFSHVSVNAERDVIVHSSYEGGRLHFVARDPANKGSSSDEYEMTMSGTDQASLSFVAFASMGQDPWVINRVQGAGELSVAADWDPNRSYVQDDSALPNAEMKRIIDEDQKARQPTRLSKEQWAVISKQDAERREATRRLLAAGSLHAGQDFASAAFIFQHGDTPDDYLLAHTLALVAVAKGETGATWIAAATLDRYLDAIGKPQIYGTQFHNKNAGPHTQEPYNRDLISDSLRHQLGVPSVSAQEEQRKRYDMPPPKSP